MALISVQDVVLGFGGPPLLDGVTLHIEEGDRLCLLGRNGVGKSTLLRLIAGRYVPDSGEVAVAGETRVAFLEQESVVSFEGSALEYCLQTASSQAEAEKHLTLLGADPASPFATLSGGGRRKVMAAAVLSADADVLLLDEPTNHLYIDLISWLEEHLTRRVKTLVMVTHDRAFARAVSNRVGELERGRLLSFDCGFDDFQRLRGEQLSAEEERDRLFDKRLAAEEVWLRRGVKARRTRNEGRVRALQAMREEYRERRSRTGLVKLAALDAGRSGDLVVEAKNLGFGYGSSKPIVNGLSTTIMRGDRVGIVGPNGAGKTTLIRLLLGDLAPQEGTVRLGANLQITYFDQLRETLDPEKTVAENLTGGDDTIVIGGKPRHISGYLKDYLFEPDRALSVTKSLSGGERNRLLLARLFAQPSNLLVMDEPTNDLDLETLELLEELLVGYRGTVILVSHDREFLDNVVTDCLVFTREGCIEELAGGYSDWQDRIRPAVKQPQPSVRSNVSHPRPGRRTDRPRKLSFKEARELDGLPDRITALEQRISAIHTLMADPEVYRDGGERVGDLARELAAKEEELAAAYRRWEELEKLSAVT